MQPHGPGRLAEAAAWAQPTLLDPDRSLAAIRAAAEAGRCLAYADVAAASFVPWAAARRRMDPHLQALCASSLARGGPLLSAIVVNRHLVAQGRMEGRALAGFAAMARRLGVAVGGDAAAFLAAEQRRVFAWAAAQAGQAIPVIAMRRPGGLPDVPEQP